MCHCLGGSAWRGCALMPGLAWLVDEYVDRGVAGLSSSFYLTDIGAGVFVVSRPRGNVLNDAAPRPAEQR
jgi:hypothetical protein